MNKRILLIWLTVISMVILTFPISQAIVPGVAASSRSKTSFDLSHLAQERATPRHAWRVVPSPNKSASYNQLDAVATVSANDVWAVGFYDDSNDVGLTLTEHWNGTKWSIVASPNLSADANELEAVAVVSSTDVWAVGYYDVTPGQPQRLIEHWNGTKWSIVPNPEHKGGLFGVAAVSANDVWAVGGDAMGDGILHWNGTKWSIVPSPHPGLGSLFQSVVAVSATDVWAVGSYYNAGSLTLIEQWNGTQWSVVPSPNPGNEEASLSGVAAVSANDVWAVGNSINQGNLQSLIEQWNGTSWSIVPSPSRGSGGDRLGGVAAISAGDVWAVGDYFNSNDVEVTLIEHGT